MKNEIRFTAASDEAGEAFLQANCNDGRCWIITTVFDIAVAHPFNTVRFPWELVTRAAMKSFWRNGKWHPIPPSILARAENRSWEEAMNACDR